MLTPVRTTARVWGTRWGRCGCPRHQGLIGGGMWDEGVRCARPPRPPPLHRPVSPHCGPAQAPGTGPVSGAPRWAESRAEPFILIRGQAPTVPTHSSPRACSPRPHCNESLCSICWAPANRRLLFRGTHSFATCPGCFLKSRVSHTDKLNLGLNVRLSGADITCCTRGHAAPRLQPVIIRDFQLQVTDRDVSSKPVTNLNSVGPVRALARLRPRRRRFMGRREEQRGFAGVVPLCSCVRLLLGHPGGSSRASSVRPQVMSTWGRRAGAAGDPGPSGPVEPAAGREAQGAPWEA